MSQLHSRTPARCPWWKRATCNSPRVLQVLEFCQQKEIKGKHHNYTSARSRRQTSDRAMPCASTEMPENLGIPVPCADSRLPGISGRRESEALIRQAAYKPLDEEISTEDMLWDLVFERSVHQHRSRVAISIDGNPHCIEHDHEQSRMMEERTSSHSLCTSVLRPLT